MTPNIVKGSNSLPSDRYDDPNHPANQASFQANKTEKSQESDMSSGGMDGDHAGKTMDRGANAATNLTEMSEGIHEDAKQTAGAGQKETGQGTSVFDANKGSIGSAFAKDGSIGQIGEKVGGPFSSEGMIGKNFTQGGSIGGTFQKLADKNQEH